jgi:cell division protein FtsW
VGPGRGHDQISHPDAHSDFIFAVAGEEFGLVLCGAIALLFCVLSVRLLLRVGARDPFAAAGRRGPRDCRGAAGLHQYGRGVSLLPAKGMTLPFISYGGSSLFAVALTMGLRWR